MSSNDVFCKDVFTAKNERQIRQREQYRCT